MTTHSFRGQVRVQDIQDEFDSLIESINKLIDVYNQAESSLGNVDFSNGKDQLSPAGFALTIGGLKKIIAAYQGDIWGCQVWKSANGCIITSGLWFKDDKVVPIPSGRVSGTLGRYIDYNPDTGVFTSSNTKGSNTIRCINPRRSSSILHTIKEFIAIHPTLKVFTGNTAKEYKTNNTINTNDEVIFSPILGEAYGDYNSLYFQGTELESAYRSTDHNGKQLWLLHKFWKPKGIANPFTFRWYSKDSKSALFQLGSLIKRT